MNRVTKSTALRQSTALGKDGAGDYANAFGSFRCPKIFFLLLLLLLLLLQDLWHHKQTVQPGRCGSWLRCQHNNVCLSRCLTQLRKKIYVINYGGSINTCVQNRIMQIDTGLV